MSQDTYTSSMDEAAEVAADELEEIQKTTDISKVANWMKKHYMKAGYKRLSKVLLAYTKKGE